ncbi:MAG: M48 family metalloprotease [Rickettsiales bacterium]|jgi:predicted Zn-dependent protease|nr:M48 family metalloprotease [Rickettsiales bacterium]
MKNEELRMKNERRASRALKNFLLFFFILNSSFFIAPARGAAIIRDTEIEAALDKIARPVMVAAKVDPRRMKINILSDNEFNAFVLGGQDAFVNTGLIVKIENPAELQAVLAHEIGHAELGHMVQMRAKMRAEFVRSLIVSALGVGMAATVSPEAGIGMIGASVAASRQSMLSFSREEERSADDFAIKTLVKAGVDPNALLSVFQKMQSARENAINPHHIGHPLTEERMKNIKVQLTINNEQLTMNDQLTLELKLVQAKLIGYLDSAERIRTLYPASDKSDAAIYARAIANARTGDLNTARIGVKTLVTRRPDNPYFLELTGDVEFKSGNYDDSIAAYEKSLRLLQGAPHSFPSGSALARNDKQFAPQIELALALVLAERNKDGDRARATAAAKRALLSERLPLAFWVLAKSDAEKADYYLAEYHYAMKDPKRAKSFAKSAIEKLDHSSPEYLKAKDILEQLADSR